VGVCLSKVKNKCEGGNFGSKELDHSEKDGGAGRKIFGRKKKKNKGRPISTGKQGVRFDGLCLCWKEGGGQIQIFQRKKVSLKGKKFLRASQKKKGDTKKRKRITS